MKLKLLILCLFTLCIATNAQVQLLKDTAPGTTFGNPNNFMEVNGNLIFTSDLTLWKTDGTSTNTNTILSNGNLSLRDFSSIFPSLVNPNEIIAVAQQVTQNRELNKINIVNGSATNYDINPGSASSNPTNLTEATISGIPYLFFSADGGSTGVELYKFNRNTETATLVQDFEPGVTDFSPTNLFDYSTDNSILFSGETSANGRELYKYDGNTISLLKDLNSNGSSFPRIFNLCNGKAYFVALADNNQSYIYETDGTSSGTVLITSAQFASDFYVYNDSLYFTNLLSNDYYLFKLDCQTNQLTTMALLADELINSSINNYFEFNGYLYFVVDPFDNSPELWRTDGTPSGTLMVDVDPTTTVGSDPSEFTEINGSIYFTATRTVTGRELFRITPTGSIALVANINPGNSDSNPRDFLEYNGKIYFRADDGTHGIELWSYDLTNFTASLVDDIEVGAGNGSPIPRYVFNNKLYIDAFRSGVGRELFTYQDPTLSNKSPDDLVSFKFYPNPTTNSFEITSQAPVELVTITDISGKEIKSFIGQKFEYDISNLTKGIYFVKVKSNGKVNIVKLVKY